MVSALLLQNLTVSLKPNWGRPVEKHVCFVLRCTCWKSCWGRFHRWRVGYGAGAKNWKRCNWVVVSQIFNAHPEPWGNDSIWRAYFSDGLVQPPTSTRWVQKPVVNLGYNPTMFINPGMNSSTHDGVKFHPLINDLVNGFFWGVKNSTYRGCKL